MSEQATYAELSAFLESFGHDAVFASWLSRVAGKEQALVRRDHGTLQAAALIGLPFGFFQVPNYWLFARSEDACLALLQDLVAADASANVSIPSHYDQAIQTRFPKAKFSYDRHYLLQGPAPKVQPIAGDILHLHEATLKDLPIDPELKKQIGPFSDFTPASQLFGLRVRGEIVAIAEAGVRDDRFATIGQVYTLERERGKAYGRRIVAALMEKIGADGLVPTYLVGENNLPSVRVAESLGFRFFHRLAFIDFT